MLCHDHILSYPYTSSPGYERAVAFFASTRCANGADAVVKRASRHNASINLAGYCVGWERCLAGILKIQRPNIFTI